MLNPKNNLFTYATGELSQDAFLCWLFSYAMKDADNEPELRECAIDFLRQFDEKIAAEPVIWVSEMPRRQYKSIDILLTVNDKYKVIIEDKTFTNEHDNQLKNYYNVIKTDFPDSEITGVFFKTGFQSDLYTITESNYLYFPRERIIETLEKHISETSNIIFRSYYEKIKALEEDIAAYKETPCYEWDWAQINGFYNDLKPKLEAKGICCNYGYVSNRSGGFYGMWMCEDDSGAVLYFDSPYELYLQCEFSNGDLKICYKASSKSESVISGEIRERFIWKKINNEWIDVAKKHGFKKPQRYGTGKTVTLGLYDYACEELYCDLAEKLIFKAYDCFLELVKELK